MPPSTPSRSRNPTFVELSQFPTYKGTSKARLQALYADFARQKHSSPAAFRANLDWWAHTLRALVDRRLQPGCPHGLVLRTNANLSDTFRYEGVGKPLSLGAVIVRIPTAHCARVYLEHMHPGRKANLVLLAKTELTSAKQLFPLSKFLSAPYSVYDPGSTAYWLVSTIVGKPLWWALQQTGIVGTEESTETDAQRWRRVAGDYVVLPLVEQAADRILEHQETIDNGSAADTVYSWEGFKKTFGGLALENGSMSDEDVKVVVKFLQRDRHVIAADKQVIKFLNSNSSETLLSPVDVGLVELKDAVAGLQLQIDGLHAQIDSHRDRAAEAVRAKRLPDVALSHLRARKRLEEVLRKRLGTLDNLHSTMLSIEGAAADIGIMKNYETSASTLKAILSHPALQREHIDETLDALASANADAREVDDAIRLGGQVNMEEAGGVFDEDEIERELAQLAKESEREQETKVVSKLPSVPVTPPVSQETGRQRMWDRITEAS